MTEFEGIVERELGRWADGEGDMAHDVLKRIEVAFEREFGYVPEEPDW